jgi:hypothetical protein
MAEKTEREKDIDRLFAAPLAEFTSFRNALASRLKKAGLEEDAAKVKALAKPSITAWAVNQLFYEHLDLVSHLRIAGERLRDAQLLQIGGKPADVRSSLEARRNILGTLMAHALAKLETSGHAATPEATRRINATLEAISVAASGADAEQPGRLTQDMDPPGFEVLSAWIPGSGATPKPSKDAPPQSSFRDSATDNAAAARARKQAAKTLFRQAEAALAAARTRVKKAEAGLAQAEKRKRETDSELEQARAASEKANARVQEHTREASEARKALHEAEAAAARAIKEAQRV